MIYVGNVIGLVKGERAEGYGISVAICDRRACILIAISTRKDRARDFQPFVSLYYEYNQYAGI